MDNVAWQKEKEQHRYSDWKRNNDWKSGKREYEEGEKDKQKRFFFSAVHPMERAWWENALVVTGLPHKSWGVTPTFLFGSTHWCQLGFIWLLLVRSLPFTPGNAIRLPFLLLCSYLRLQTFLLNFTAHKGQACNITHISSSDVGPAGISCGFICREGVGFFHLIQH